MTPSQIKQLQSLLGKPSNLSLTDESVLQLSLENCSEDDLAFLQTLLEKANADEPSAPSGSNPHFEEVIRSPLYKPGNPALALNMIAKKHGLDPAEFKREFREWRG